MNVLDELTNGVYNIGGLMGLKALGGNSLHSIKEILIYILDEFFVYY